MVSKQTELKKRVLEEARYFVDNSSTVRNTAKAFEISKSTVFIDLTKRLPDYNFALYLEVLKILNKNKLERALRGGLAFATKFNKKSL